jgi:hypothetical protein
MRKLQFGLLFLTFTSLSAYAAEITYTDRNATILKTEKVVSVLVSREPEIFVHIVSNGLSCRLSTKTIEEALAIQTKLASDSKSWIQCFGDFKTYESPNRIAVETDRYSLGQKLAE